MRVARRSRFHRILERDPLSEEITGSLRGSLSKGTAEPALPGRQCRPWGG